MSERLLRADEVRERLDLENVATVYRWAREGRIRCVQLSRRVVRFRETDVDEFIRGRLTGSER